MKQAAIEEGQWTEKRESSGDAVAAVIIANLHAGRQRLSFKLNGERALCRSRFAGGDGRFRLFKRAQISSFPLKRRSFPLKRRLRATVLY
jgi:hypothetical protein